MALVFNGSSSKGAYSGNLASGGYDYAIFAWIKPASANTEGMVAGFASGQATFDELAVYCHGGTSKVRSYHKSTGGLSIANSTTNQQTSWQPVLVTASTSGTKVYYAGGAVATDSTALSINTSFPNVFNVGVWPETGNSIFFNGEIAEIWIWSGTIPDATDWASLAAGALPETIKTANIVEGWTLQTQASTQTGYNGRTLTMTSTTQGGAHPITRTAGSTLTGSITLTDVDANGSISSNIALLAGSLSLDEVLASGVLGLVPGSVRTLPFTRNFGSPRPTGLTGIALAVLSDDANLSRYAGATSLSQNSDGTVSFSGSGLPSVGTSVIVLTREADGKIGAERYVVA